MKSIGLFHIETPMGSFISSYPNRLGSFLKNYATKPQKSAHLSAKPSTLVIKFSEI